MTLVPVGSQVAPSLEQIAHVGAGMDGTGGKDLRTLLRRMAMSAGINTIHQVNDTETVGDWVENNNGVFDVANDTAGKVGTNEAKMTSTGTCDGTQFISTKFIDKSADIGTEQMDWTDTRYLGFWVANKANGDYSTAGEMKVTIVNAGVEQTQVNVQAIVDDVHQFFQIDMEDNSWDRNAVESLRFYANVASGQDLYVNDIIRYEISYGRGPLYGCMFPIKSGVTATEGNLQNWSIDGVIAGADAITGLGPCALFTDGAPVTTLLGRAQRDTWAMFPGKMLCILRASEATVAGEGVIYAAAGTIKGVATGVSENAVGKVLEVAGAANDDVFVLINNGVDFIS